MITAAEIVAIMACTEARAALWQPHLAKAMDLFDISTPLRIAAFLAQVGHESGRLVFVREIWNPVQCPWQLRYNSKADLGNTRPEAIAIAAKHGSTPGPWWKGHGLIQITGYDNHLACGEALNLDLLNHPVQLEQPANAALSAAWFWSTHGCNKFADAGDLDGVSDVINLGRKTTRVGDSNGYADRLALYESAKFALTTDGKNAFS
jgi:putative chitinase